ncbi:MAG: TonB family protein [Acidobacteria bacterium]|nr:TonB family protein [Acidobacteriota bacterium]
MDAVTQVLVDRSREADKISRMVILSLAAHAVFVAAVAFMPSTWSTTVRPDPSRTMVISLEGAPGPRQGMTAISAKPVQEVAPNPPKAHEQAPPALTKPEMVEPLKTAKPQPKAIARPDTKKIEPQLHGPTPTKGTEVKEGAARVETGGQKTPFGGLATGGAAGAGAALTDYADFCCPEYLTTLVQIVQRNWQQNQGVDGTVIVKTTILRNGTLTDIQVEQQSVPFLNLAAQRAVVQTKQGPPLPAAFTGNQLTVHLVFQFKR